MVVREGVCDRVVGFMGIRVAVEGVELPFGVIWGSLLGHGFVADGPA